MLTLSTIAAPVAADVAALGALFRDSVEHGASIGYVLPLEQAVVDSYWRSVFADVDAGRRVLIAARNSGKLCGSAQLDLCAKPNGLHRAEVQKVMVHSACRRRGYALKLMAQIEHEAIARGRTLLTLDTETGSGAESLYEKCGYQRVGSIPRFALSPGRELHATTVFYRELVAPK